MRFNSFSLTETVHMVETLPSKAMKTIRLPSGDHDGAPCPPGGLPICVTDLGSPPRVGTIHRVEGGMAPIEVALRSVSPYDWNASKEPSGDHAGREPNSVNCLAVPPEAGASQMPPRFFE